MRKSVAKAAVAVVCAVLTGPALAGRPAPTLVIQEGRSYSNGGGTFRAVALSADGKWLITGNADKTVRLFDAASGRELRTFRAESCVNSVALSADKKQLVIIDSGGASLWDVATATQSHLFYLQQGAFRERYTLHSAALTRDGRRLVTNGNTPILWNVAAGRDMHRFERPDAERTHANCVALSGDDKWMASGGVDACLWELDTGKLVRTFKGHKKGVMAVVFSADGKRLFTGGEDGTIRIWDIASGKEERVLQSHRREVTSLALSPDGKWLASASSYDESNLAKFWDLTQGKVLREFEARVVAFSPDGKLLLCGGEEDAKMLDPVSGKEVMVFKGQCEPTTHMALSSDAKWLITASGFGHNMITVWDLAKGRPVRSFRTIGTPEALAMTSDGGRIVTSGYNFEGSKSKNMLRFWERDTGKQVRTIEGSSEGRINCLAFSSDDQWLVAGHNRWTECDITLWDAAQDKKIKTFSAKGGLVSVTLSHDRAWLLAGFLNTLREPNARLWDVQTGQQVHALTDLSGSVNAVITRDSKKFVTSPGDFAVGGTKSPLLWDLRSGKKIGAFLGHDSRVNCLAFSEDQKRLVTGSADGSVRLWSMATTNTIRVLGGHSDEVIRLALTRDGKRLISLCADQSLRLWDVDSGKLLCRLVSFRDGTWAVVDADNRYDAAGDGKVAELHWVAGDDVFPLQKHAAPYYDPGLLAKHMGFERARLRELPRKE